MGPRAERAISIAVLAVRTTFVVQLILAVIDGTARSGRPILFVGLSAAMVLESVVLGVALLRQRVLTRAATLSDLAVIVVLILTEPLYSGPADRVGTWLAWGFGAGAVGALSAGVGLPRLRHAALAGLTLTAAYLAVSLPAGLQTGSAWTAVTNSVALIGFAVGSWVTGRFIRDLAGVADAARLEAAEAARRAAVDRQRLLLHDHATVLSLLSRPGLDESTESVLRDQAARSSRQIRTFLAQEDPGGLGAPGAEEPMSLAALLISVAEEFADLPLTVNVDLAVDVVLGPVDARALAAAVRTLLHNVRRHAQADAVTVHADEAARGSWEVTVQDDGVGFDHQQSPGFGLRVQAGSALRDLGMSVAVDSERGEGTRVTIIGRVDA